MSDNFLLWLKGLLSAFIGAASQAITVMVVDPAAFNLGAQWKKTLTAALVGGVVAVAAYLTRSPIPTPKENQS